MKLRFLSLLLMLSLLFTSIPFVATAAVAGEVMETGKISSPDGENETVTYRIVLNNDLSTHTVYVEDLTGDGATPNYEGNANATEQVPSMMTLPWHSSSKYTITHFIVDESITSVGQYFICTQYIANITDIYFMGENTAIHNKVCYESSKHPVAGSITVHSFTGSNRTGFSKACFAFSYIEAEQFMEKYTALWSVSESNSASVAANAASIANAKAELTILSSNQSAYNQLQTATIPNSSVTYAAKVDALYNALPDNLQSSVTHTLSADNKTLTLSGMGALTDSTEAPWASALATIEKVIISEGITAISAGALSDLSALQEVDMAKTVETIAAGAFPAHSFELHGWLNHASGRYAEANGNVSLKVKEVRILSLGNSHTDDYTWWFKNILSDLEAATGTVFTHEKVTRGARRMYSTTASAGSHYDGAKTSSDPKYAAYRAAFAKTWDFVVIQDYHESTYANGGSAFADSVAATVAWLHEDAPGAKIAWFADLVEPQNRNADKTGGDYYSRSVAAMQAAAALTQNAPDLIVPVSTLWENAYTSYFGSTLNRADVSPDYEPSGADLPILERDSAHVSHLLGRQLTGMAVMYGICDLLEGMFDTSSFDYFDAITTKPTSAQSEYSWKGEFLDEYWPVLEELISNAYRKPYERTASAYTEDPFDAKFNQVKSIMASIAATLPETLSLSVLESHFKTASVASRLSAIEGLGTITTDNISVAYANETVTVEVDCHYGVSFSIRPAYTTGETMGDKVLIETGKLPSSLGEDESMLYQIYLNPDGQTHTVFIHNPSYTDQTPDYESGGNASAENPSLATLPWNSAPYSATVTTIIVDESINYLGKYLICTNYAQAVTDIYIYNPDATLHANMLFDQADKGDTVHTVHLYSGVDISGLAKKSYYSFSYLEAEEFIEEYDALWAVDSANVSAVLGVGSTITAAKSALAALPEAAKTQVTTATLPESAATYAAHLDALYAVLSASSDQTAGDVNGDGSVNLLDVMIALRILSGKDYSGALEERELFLTGDNVADMADVVLLMRRAAGWDVMSVPAPDGVEILFNADTFTYYYEIA